MGKSGADLIRSSRASLVICHLSAKPFLGETKSSLIFVDNPRLWFIRCLRRYAKSPLPRGISSKAIVRSRKVGKNVYVGPFSFIEKDVSIGDNSTIYGGVHIYGNTSIGKHVSVDSCSVIGADGFGFERNERQELEKFPHFGGVRIEDSVEVGANVCIDRGSLQDTVIGSGTKIDNLVHVAHNVTIGANCMIVAQSLLGGSCVLGDNVFIGASASIRDGGIKVGNNAFVGMGAVVTKDVVDNTTVAGVPARPMSRARR